LFWKKDFDKSFPIGKGVKSSLKKSIAELSLKRYRK
jgi:hypothetical protein